MDEGGWVGGVKRMKHEYRTIGGQDKNSGRGRGLTGVAYDLVDGAV